MKLLLLAYAASAVVVSTVGGATASKPFGITFDSNGNLFITATSANKIQKLAAGSSVFTDFSGSGAKSFTDGVAASAKFSGPTGITHNSTGSFFVADNGNKKIRQVASDGTVSTYLTTTSAPNAVAFNVTGEMFIGAGTTIVKMDLAGTQTIYAGSTTSGFDDGPVASAKFRFIYDVAFDSAGNLFVSTQGNNIRKISTDGIVSTFAGSTAGYQDGAGASAQLNMPTGLAFDGTGNLYVAEYLNHKIRKIDSSGTVTTVAGGTGAAASGTTDGSGEDSRFLNPWGISFDAQGNLFVADSGNDRIRKITFPSTTTTASSSITSSSIFLSSSDSQTPSTPFL